MFCSQLAFEVVVANFLRTLGRPVLHPFSSDCSLNHWKSIDMYKILNDHVAVPGAPVDLILSSRPSRSVDANSQKLVTVRSFTENCPVG